LDAYCLLEIFDWVRKRTKELEINFDLKKWIGKKNKPANSESQNVQLKNEKEMLNKNLRKLSLHSFSNSKEESSTIDEFVINEMPIKAKDLRIVCDNMLAGLGRELRRCGIDTVILENEREHVEVARVRK
jgi:hypothetical protein